MPKIISSTTLRNEYNDISTFCHDAREAVFVTKNGQGDLAVMSIEAYEELTGKAELYRLLDEGQRDVNSGRVRPYRQVREDLLDGNV